MKIKKIIYSILFVTPLIIGVVSYMYEGKHILDALYYSICLYGFNYTGDETPVLGLEIARWLAPLMTASSVLLAAKFVLSYIYASVFAFRKDSNIVYGDSLHIKDFCHMENRVVYSDKVPIRHGKNHYIMFSSDADNFSFLQNNAKCFAGKNVYLCLNEMDAALLKSEISKKISDNIRIKFFNANDVIARNFWKECQLWNNAKTEWKIAIVGFGSLGKRLLERALQLNLFATDQQIEYYIFGNCKRFELSHTSLDLMNRDKVFYYDTDSDEQWGLFCSMDLIIVSEETDVDLLQNILGCSSSKTIIYYYSPGDDNLCHYMETDRLLSYGYNHTVFTLENIKTDILYENAIALNQIYKKKYNSVDWSGLTGFVRESNISAADYGEIIQILHKKGLSEEELAKLEHIRWCRFHFLHYWKYGIPLSGTNKDKQKKIHKLLVPYDKLEIDGKDKAIEVIQMWNSFCPK